MEILIRSDQKCFQFWLLNTSENENKLHFIKMKSIFFSHKRWYNNYLIWISFIAPTIENGKEFCICCVLVFSPSAEKNRFEILIFL